MSRKTSHLIAAFSLEALKQIPTGKLIDFVWSADTAPEPITAVFSTKTGEKKLADYVTKYPNTVLFTDFTHKSKGGIPGTQTVRTSHDDLQQRGAAYLSQIKEGFRASLPTVIDTTGIQLPGHGGPAPL